MPFEPWAGGMKILEKQGAEHGCKNVDFEHERLQPFF